MCKDLVDWTDDGSAFIENASSYYECKSLLLMAQEDIKQCND
jgi:hypothetical protein